MTINLSRLSIGSMAKLNHVSEQTLRLYDRIGLLVPKYTDQRSGYRYYSIGQSMTLDLIQYYKHMGFPLEQIKENLDKSDDAPLQICLEQRYSEISAEIGRLKMCLSSIRRTMDNQKKYLSLPRNGEIFLEYAAERHIITYRTDHNILQSDYEHYEYALRLLKNYLLEIDFPMIYFCNAGTIIRREHLMNHSLYSNEIYLLVDENVEAYTGRAVAETIPEGTYLSMCCAQFDREREYAAALLDELARKHYEINGDYICEVISEFPNKENQQYYYKIQIKIR